MRPCLRLRHAGDQRPVDLARRARAEGLGERGGGKARLGDQQAAGGVLVEPVHQARALAVGVAQHVEHAVEMARGAGAALHREPHRLVEHQHVGVLVQRDRFEEGAGLRRRLALGRQRPRLVEPQRRDAHRLPGLQPVLRLRALAVHAQLAFADDALDVGERQSRETAPRESDRPACRIRRRSPRRSGRCSSPRRRRLRARVWVLPARSWTPPQLFRPRAAPFEHQPVAAHLEPDRHAIAERPLAPALCADMPGVAHQIARADGAVPARPGERQRRDRDAATPAAPSLVQALGSAAQRPSYGGPASAGVATTANTMTVLTQAIMRRRAPCAASPNSPAAS